MAKQTYNPIYVTSFNCQGHPNEGRVVVACSQRAGRDRKEGITIKGQYEGN